MERFKEMVNNISNEDLEYLLSQITTSLENTIDSLVPIKKLSKMLDTYDLELEDFILFQDVSNHIMVESTTKKTFEVGDEILEKLGVEEEKIDIYQKVFQEQAQTIWQQVKDQAHATKNVLKEVSTRVTLPLHESQNPIIQQFTFNDKLKFNYSDDVKNPRLDLCFEFKNLDHGRKETKKLDVQFEKLQAQNLFEEVERIKEHLDMLLAKV